MAFECACACVAASFSISGEHSGPCRTSHLIIGSSSGLLLDAGDVGDARSARRAGGEAIATEPRLPALKPQTDLQPHSTTFVSATLHSQDYKAHF